MNFKNIYKKCFPTYLPNLFNLGSEEETFNILFLALFEHTIITIYPVLVVGGRFDYMHQSASGTSSCEGTGDTWDMCADNKQMAFDLPTCPTLVAYSGIHDVNVWANFRQIWHVLIQSLICEEVKKM